MNEIKDFIEKYQKLLALNGSISYTEAERRSSEFLHAQATLINWRHILSEEKIRLVSVQTAVYASQMALGGGKTVTQNKIDAEASVDYKIAREELENIENDINYLKSYYDIFLNGHIFYRQLSKEGRE